MFPVIRKIKQDRRMAPSQNVLARRLQEQRPHPAMAPTARTTNAVYKEVRYSTFIIRM
jgi:hypothetical protein